MRVGFDITPLLTARSGVAIYTMNLLKHLEQLAHIEILRLAHRASDVGQAGDGPDLSRRQIGASALWLNKTVWMQLLLPNQLRRLRLDSCHFTNGVASLWAPCPTILTIHDMTVWLFPQYHYGRRLLAMRPFVPLAARRAAAIIAVSQATKRDIVRILGVEESKVHVVHEAAPPHFRPVDCVEDLEEVRRRHNLPPRFMLCVGTIEPRKNLVRLLEAYALLRRNHPVDHALVFVGDRGWKDEAVFAAVERLGLNGAACFLNYVTASDLVALYNLADLVAYPSLYEGFGLPVLEAMSCGTPVVTSRNGSLAEVAGDAAEFVDPTNVESIAEGLWRVVSDPAWQEELRVRGTAQAARFSWVTAARQTSQIYADVRRKGSRDIH